MGSFADFRAVAVYAEAELALTALAALVIYTKAPPLPHTPAHHPPSLS